MTPRKEKALCAILTHATQAEAAQAAGIGETTLRGYLREPEFQTAYRRAVSDMLESAARQARNTLAPAITRLRSIVEDDEQTAQAQIQASRELANLAIKLHELTNIDQRLQELEAWKEGQTP